MLTEVAEKEYPWSQALLRLEGEFLECQHRVLATNIEDNGGNARKETIEIAMVKKKGVNWC
jgi:hypothetical protein